MKRANWRRAVTVPGLLMGLALTGCDGGAGQTVEMKFPENTGPPPKASTGKDADIRAGTSSQGDPQSYSQAN